MSGYFFFVTAYMFIWLCLAWYMFSLSKKQQLLQDEIRLLKGRVQVRE